MKKMLFTGALISSVFLAGCSQSATVASTTAGKISEDELYEEMKSQVGVQVLENMLLEEILESAYGDQVSQEQVDAKIKEEEDKVGGEDNFDIYLQAQGVSREEYAESVRLLLLIQEAVIDYKDYSEEDIQAYYDNYNPPATVSHILVEDEETAQEVLTKLDEGAEFEDLVQEYSTDTGTVQNNGQLTINAGDTVKEFEEAASNLEEGEITEEPVETIYGYHIIRMDEKPEKGSYEDEKENMKTLMVEEDMQDTATVQEAVAQVVQDANVIIEDDSLNGALSGLLAPKEEDSSSEAEGEESEGEEESSQEEADSQEEDEDQEGSESESEADVESSEEADQDNTEEETSQAE